jgi:hypothetical protein
MENPYVWQEQYKAAMFETDRAKLRQLIQAAKLSIDDRLQELLMDHGGTPEERQAISDALAGLNVIREN